ncbi:MAG: cadmium-translocating P-type ATPase [Actinomycetota bacterium]|nr:cadmium-translocating P-type ATPase [Actinomycetota bacterium]
MDCPSCADDIKASLARLEGVEDVRVDVVVGRVTVAYAEGKLARGDIAGAIRRVGYRVEDGEARRATFTVDQMDCADEVRQIEGALGKLPGVTNLQFDLVNRRLVVEGTIVASEVQRAVRAIGMTARPEGDEARPLSFWERRGRLVMTAVSGALLTAGVGLAWAGVEGVVPVVLLALSTVAGGWFIVPRGLRAARSGALDMNFLMTIAAAGAAGIGEWGEGASAMFLFSVAQLLESFSMDRARNAIKALMDLSPSEATVRRDGGEETVPVSDVLVDEVLVVRPGQRIPLDGVVVSGRSAVNQAPITGESAPVDKEPGAEVFAGSINEQGVLDVRVTKLVEDSTLARIIHAVEEAQGSRAPSQSFVDRFSRIYTPAVVALAVLVFLVPPLLGLGAWGEWFYRALAMLVIACPCALVISTPVSLVSGLASAARGGVLIKGGLHLENTGRVTAVAFDKTGTLTVGRPAVTDVVALDDSSNEEVLRLAAAVEQGSEHPLARAVLERARAAGVGVPPTSEFEALVGRGVRASVEGRTLYLGNERLAHERRVCTGESEMTMELLEREGKTAVLLASDSGPIGVLGVADTPRPEAADAITALRAAGIRHVVMLTGDNTGTARAVARELGIEDVRAGLLPEDKVRVVRELEAAGERVAFVGDGVNDAPALAAATVGLAMGAAGTDVALETADVALMGDDLARLPFAVRLSRSTLAVIKQNIVFSIAIKAVFLVLALAGLATLWMAVAADMGASLAVVFNGLRLLRAGKDEAP